MKFVGTKRKCRNKYAYLNTLDELTDWNAESLSLIVVNTINEEVGSIHPPLFIRNPLPSSKIYELSTIKFIHKTQKIRVRKSDDDQVLIVIENILK